MAPRYPNFLRLYSILVLKWSKHQPVAAKKTPAITVSKLHMEKITRGPEANISASLTQLDRHLTCSSTRFSVDFLAVAIVEIPNRTW